MSQKDGTDEKNNCFAEETSRFLAPVCQHIIFSDPSPRDLAPSSDLHRQQAHISCADMHISKKLKHIKIIKGNVLKSYHKCLQLSLLILSSYI